jgi:hypothetical protein
MRYIYGDIVVGKDELTMTAVLANIFDSLSRQQAVLKSGLQQALPKWRLGQQSASSMRLKHCTKQLHVVRGFAIKDNLVKLKGFDRLLTRGDVVLHVQLKDGDVRDYQRGMARHLAQSADSTCRHVSSSSPCSATTFARRSMRMIATLSPRAYAMVRWRCAGRLQRAWRVRRKLAYPYM